MPYRIIPPKKWPARDEVRKLAREHTVEAMEKLIKLMQKSKSDFVVATAARTVLLRADPDRPRKNSRLTRSEARRRTRTLNVKITRLTEGEADGK